MRPVVKDSKQAEDVIDVSVDKVTEAWVVGSTASKKEANLVAPDDSAVISELTLRNLSTNELVGCLKIDDPGQDLTGTRAEMPGGIGVLRIDRIERALPAIIKVSRDYAKLVVSTVLSIAA